MIDPSVIPIEMQFIIGFVFSFLAGFLIGFERGSREKPAGVRTHTLVCTGAMLFTLLSLHFDPNSTSRIAANIVVGIGFLGAGIIMQHQGSIFGVTTAATIWMTAAIGMAIGFGWYMTSVLATIFAFAVLKMPHFGEHGPPGIDQPRPQLADKRSKRKKK